MKLAVLSASLAATLMHPGSTAAQQAVRLLTPPQAEVVEMGPHHRVWSRTELVPDGMGGWRAEERRVTELATGLGRWDEGQRAYVGARAAFEVTESGHVIARETAHQLILPPDLSESAVDMLAPDGARLGWQLIGLAMIDRASGQSVLLGEAQPSAAQWLGEQEVLYPNALSGIAADVRYRLTLDGLEQDLILREQVAPELVADLGLNPAACRLMVLTEFVSFPEETTTERRTLGEVLADGTVGTDEDVSFGAMRIGAGRAFGLEEAEGSWLRVAKSWEVLDGRQVLVESVDYAGLGPLMDRLPLPEQGRIDRLKERVQRTAKVARPGGEGRYAGLVLPVRRGEPAQARVKAPGFRDGRLETGAGSMVHLGTGAGACARAPMGQGRGLVVDFALQTICATNFTFRGDTTYYVSGTVNLSGTTTIEGGAVIKYGASGPPKVVCLGDIVCNTAAFCPAVFTAKDDDTVGETITGSTGSPYVSDYANPAIEVRTSGSRLHDLRLAHAGTGLKFSDSSAGNHQVSHVQMVHCNSALIVEGNGALSNHVALRNVLIDRATYGLYGSSFQVTGEHLTAHQCTHLAYNSSTSYVSGLSLTNSLLVAVITNGTVSLGQSCCQWPGSSNGVFQTVGAGGFYLADGAYREAGTTNIDAALAADLKRKTTYPPLVWSNAVVTTDTVLSPQAGRDTDLLDLGYHYDPIDHAVSLFTVTNALATNGIAPPPVTLTVLPGTVIGQFGSRGLQMEYNSRLMAEGTPTAPVRLVRYDGVQEQSIAWGGTNAGAYLVLGPPRDAVEGLTNSPGVSLRYVEGTLLGGMGYGFVSGNGWWLWKAIEVQDCQWTGGRFQVSGYPGTTAVLRNNVFAWTWHRGYGWPAYEVYNNLFYGGTVRLERYAAGGAWTLRDNAFDSVALTNANAAVVNDHNAYLGLGQAQLPGSGGSDQVLSSFIYTNLAVRPSWRFYQVSTDLVDKGSRNATNAGLYHFTTQISQVKETNSVVDIGFHYVAVDTATGLPLDTDGDGLSDYFEDRNGNGVYDRGASETDWVNSPHGTTGMTGLQVFTPFE